MLFDSFGDVFLAVHQINQGSSSRHSIIKYSTGDVEWMNEYRDLYGRSHSLASLISGDGTTTLLYVGGSINTVDTTS